MPSKCPDCGALRKPNESCSCSGGTKQKKKSRWDETRPNVKPLFEAAGFTYCELRLPGCNEAIGTGFAHTKKQRHLTDKELSIVAFLCNNCHNRIEGKPEMEDIILSIRRRNKIPEIDSIIEEVYGTRTNRKEV